ncbi:MAG: hypothetical protein U0263_22005 [Polyangiaceae bacterium]
MVVAGFSVRTPGASRAPSLERLLEQHASSVTLPSPARRACSKRVGAAVNAQNRSTLSASAGPRRRASRRASSEPALDRARLSGRSGGQRHEGDVSEALEHVLDVRVELIGAHAQENEVTVLRDCGDTLGARDLEPSAGPILALDHERSALTHARGANHEARGMSRGREVRAVHAAERAGTDDRDVHPPSEPQA